MQLAQRRPPQQQQAYLFDAHLAPGIFLQQIMHVVQLATTTHSPAVSCSGRGLPCAGYCQNARALLARQVFQLANPISQHQPSHPTTLPPTHPHTGDHAGRLIFEPPVQTVACSVFFLIGRQTPPPPPPPPPGGTARAQAASPPPPPPPPSHKPKTTKRQKDKENEQKAEEKKKKTFLLGQPLTSLPSLLTQPYWTGLRS
jgi:outer membrane biosynthesis protein TonB